MVTLVYGRAGSGKSRLVREMAQNAIANGERVFVIVPEQATFLTERDLLLQQNRESIANSRVLSFAQLSECILEETSGASRSTLSEQGAVMAMYALLRRHEKDFSVLRGYAASPANLQPLYQELCELRRYRVPAEILQEDSSMRVRDLGLLMRLYESEIGAVLMDGVGRMELAIAQAPQSQLLKGALIIIDGFDAVTQQVLALLREIMRQAKHTVVTFRMGEPTDLNAAIFEAERDTFERVQALAKEMDQAVQVKTAAQFRQESAELRHLEQNLFTLSPQRYDGPNDGAILLKVARHPREEAAAAARFIRKCVKEGLRYREIFVQLCDETMAQTVRAVFADYHIPCFMDQKRPIAQKALCRFIMNVVRCAAFGMQQQDVISVLQSGFLPCSRQEAAAARTYLEESKTMYLTQKRVEQAPAEAYGALQALEQAVQPLAGKRHRTAAQWARAAYRAIEPFVPKMEEYLGHLAQQSPEVQSEERQAYEAMMELLSQMEALLGETQMDLPLFYQTLRAGALAQEIALVPPTLDCVSVGDLARSRAGEVKCLVVLGASSAFLPKPLFPSAIFPQRDKERLQKEKGLWMGSSVQERISEQEAGIYGALCKPKQKLYLSYSAADAAGKPQLPAAVCEEIRNMFGMKEYSPAQTFTDAIEYAVTPRLAAAAAEKALNTMQEGAVIDPAFSALAAVAQESAQRASQRPELGEITHSASRSLFLPGGRMTVSRLESFAECPFRHFVEKGLAPREEERYELDVQSQGTAIHSVLQQMVEDWISNPFSPDQAEQRSAEYVHKAMEQAEIPEHPQKDYELRQLHRMARDACGAACRHLIRGSFRPCALEYHFSPKDLQLTGPQGESISTHGYIDRVDSATLPDGSKILRILDYKSGKTGAAFQPKEVESGKKLQLPLYATAAEKAFDGQVVGMFYMPVRGRTQGKDPEDYRLSGVVQNDPNILIAMENAEQAEVLPKQKKAFLSAEEFRSVLDTAQKTADELCSRMLQGEIAPNDAAKYCETCSCRSICPKMMGERGEEDGLDADAAECD